MLLLLAFLIAEFAEAKTQSKKESTLRLLGELCVLRLRQLAGLLRNLHTQEKASILFPAANSLKRGSTHAGLCRRELTSRRRLTCWINCGRLSRPISRSIR